MNTQTLTTRRAEAAEVIAEAATEGFDLSSLSYQGADRLRETLASYRAARDYQPQVGDGMTLYYPQDRYPFVITRVSPSGKTVWVKPLRTVDRTTGHEPARFDGPFPVWSHLYTDEERQSMLQEDAPERMVRRSRDGLSWSSHGTEMGYGGARYHRNYSY